MLLDVLIILEEIRHAVCFDFRQTRRNGKNGSNDAGLLIFRIKNTVYASAISNQSEHIGQWATPHLSDVRRGAPSWIWD